ncbi:HD domain-containing protein [Patescibacteria group bacterium]|nr:HD domain-containing protein [Patescibacteria group bacterium]
MNFKEWLAAVSEMEDRDDEEYFIHLPYSDLRCWVYNDETIFQASEAFPAKRLNGVRQLSFLAYVGPDPLRQLCPEFHHTRFDHTLVVARVMEQILKINALGEKEVDKGVVAAILHDIATPALGDAAKAIDPQGLNEETHWQEMLDERGWQYLASIGATPEEIGDIIQNKGVLGKALDIADKVTYVLKDAHAITVSPVSPFVEDEYTADLRQELRADPKIGNIYREAKIDKEKGEVYFEDPERLRRFLKIRAILHQKLYMHPASQGRDLKFASLLKPFYSPDGNSQKPLTPGKLRKINDEGLIRFLTSAYRTPNNGLGSQQFYYDLVSWFPPYYEKFESLIKAESRIGELAEKPGITIVGVKECKGFKTATDYKVLNESGEVVRFRDYDPKSAEEIEEISRSTQGVYVYFAEDSQETSNFHTFFKELTV